MSLITWHGLTGDIPAGELELRDLTIGGVEVPRRRVRVGPIEIVNALVRRKEVIASLRDKSEI